MLKLEEIKKTYLAGESKVEALKGISVEFRKNEFVSILGQSGCGKTTLLNIIGGLDRYTSGDLTVNGKSTKKFNDRDWDSYRNHSIGFVFQTYNLIPHQTVLSNVELALTLSGVSKTERKQRAVEALTKVGLKDQINKKPNQLSGGQMQRVAIARALVNNPEILLADEPTGALDSETSIQIMELLKEIAKDRLIIMVTHNPELAEKYSTRIIKLLDGKIIDDSNPYKSQRTGKEENFKQNKTHMKLLTALSLSFNNLLTKKGRTFLTAFAGSIGIIGIALILALSTGVNNYIKKVEEDTLSSYPITIEEKTMNINGMVETLAGEVETDQTEHEEGKIYSLDIMTDMLNIVSTEVKTNNLEAFKQFVEAENSEIKNNSSAIQYSYGIDLNLYNVKEEDFIKVNPNQIMNALGMGGMMEAQATSGMNMSASMSTGNVWQEMLDNRELLETQYNVLAGKWPEQYNEVVLIVDENNQITDYALYSLGLKDQEELSKKYQQLLKGEATEKSEQIVYNYEDFLNLSFKVLLNTDYYKKVNNMWIDMSNDEEYIKEKLATAEEIKVVGIIQAKPEAVTTAMTGSIGYLSSLEEHVINKANEAEITKQQKENPDINIFTGMEFPEELSLTGTNVSYSSLTNEQKQYLSSLSQDELASVLEAYSENSNATYEKNLKKIGAVDLNKPSAIYIYPKNFEAKENIAAAIENYNKNKENEGKEEDVIMYTDIVGIMLDSVTVIINVISYILIAFVAISLIVSSIMIGIITYISVLERTKEIGILRSIGASKKDISRVFNAETFIVGTAAGLIGIGTTLLLTIPINAILKNVANINAAATLPVGGAVALIIISMILTVIAGLIPAKVAAKKDPVVALRTE